MVEEKGTGHSRRRRAMEKDRGNRRTRLGKEGYSARSINLNWWYSWSVSMETTAVDIHKQPKRKEKNRKSRVTHA